MMESFNPASIPLQAGSSLDLSRHLLTIKEQVFSVTLADATIPITAKWLIVNIFTWRPLVRRGLPVERRHTMHDGLVTNKRLAGIKTEIYNDVVAWHMENAGAVPPAEIRAILEDLCETENDLDTAITTQQGAYHLSISAFELSDLLLHPEVKALTDIDVSAEMLIGISATEAKLKASGLAIMEKFKDRSLPSNVLAPFVELGQLSEKQLPQVVSALGFRKDASDNMVRLPIMSSYIGGLKNITEFAIESLSAKLNTYYAKNAMPEAQYSNRKQQLLSSAIRRLYPGDCGSTLTVPFYVHQNNARNVLDKNIVVDGRLLRLTKHNVNDHVGTTVQLRSPLTCRHTDGICHICGGHLTDFMPAHTVVGIACTVEYMSAVSQLVLSTKHFSSTKAIAYIVPDQLRDFLFVKQNDIFIREAIDIDRLKIAVSFRDIPYIKEIRAADKDGEAVAPIGDKQFSSIRSMIFADAASDTLATPEVSLISNGTIPYFSAELLNFIREHPRSVTITDDLVWISLKNFDRTNEPLLRYVVQSNSMMRFNNELETFATSDIGDYTSLKEALTDFSEKVFQEINVNLFHLETVLKSYLITSDQDYNVPLVTDIDNVRFGTLLTIMPRRSLGGMLAYERLGEFMAKEPELYLLPHREGLFDSFFYAEHE